MESYDTGGSLDGHEGGVDMSYDDLGADVQGQQAMSHHGDLSATELLSPSKLAQDKRRCERNAREQKRSHKISETIRTLRTLLHAAGMHPKSSKYSVLTTSAQYIRELQNRTAFIEAERSRWMSIKESRSYSKPRNAFVPPIVSLDEVDYRVVFQCAPTPLAICSLDGRFVDSNMRFVEQSGYDKSELLQLTLFNLTVVEELQQTFSLVSGLLGNVDQLDRTFEVRARLRNGSHEASISLTVLRNSQRQFECFLVTLLFAESTSSEGDHVAEMNHPNNHSTPA